MNTDSEVAIPFNKRSLRQLFLTMLLFSAMGVLLVVFEIHGVFFDNLNAGRSFFASAIYFTGCCLLLFVSWASVSWAWFLGRCLHCDTPAFVFCQSGIVNNVSGYWVGLLRWEEMERVYPSSLVRELRLPRRWHLRLFAMRCIILVPKSGIGPGARLLPFRFKNWLMWLDRRQGWFGAGERLLSVPVDEFMQTLNQYYVSSVRREGLP